MAKFILSAFADEAGDSLAEQIAALKENGIRYIEPRNIDKKGILTLTDGELAEVRRALDESGISVYSLGSPIGKSDIHDDFAKVEDKLKHTCELAKTLSTDKIRMFSFHHATEERGEVLERLNKMVEIANAYGVGLYHENEKGIYGDIAERVQDIIDNVPGLYHVYDPANFLQVGEPADKTLDMFHARADYFHIKDVIAATGELVPAGYGDGKIDRLLSDIKEDKVLTVEPHLKIFDGYGQIDDTQMKHKFHFTDNNEAFDAAINALKALLGIAGYREEKGVFVK